MARRSQKKNTNTGKPFDAVTRTLVSLRPADWVRWLNLVSAERPFTVEVLDTDLSTVTTAADGVLRIDSPEGSFLLHKEFQTSWDDGLAIRLLRYAVLLYEAHQLPVRTVVFLLSPRADHSTLTGELVMPGTGQSGVDEPPALIFRYLCVRVWQLPAEELIAGPLALVPFAPIGANAPKERVPELLRRLEDRCIAEASPADASELVMAASVLLGLRYDESEIVELVQGIQQMKESSFYQMVLHEGEAQGERKMLLHMGSLKFGAISPEARTTLDTVTDRAMLEALAGRLLHVNSWDELLAELAVDNDKPALRSRKSTTH